MEVTLAIDYGSARVGTAVSVGWMARPLDVFPHGSIESLLARLLALCTQEQVTKIVVGLPLNADGTEGEQATVVRGFATELAQTTNLEIFLWNEYGSSQAAQAQMIGASRSRKARREKLDAIAAALFLQEFVEQNGVGAERVYPKDQQRHE
ncbi:MAG: Holliday junction resolvase RuvX [Ardenticatenales bacterium]|nr:Holliday junction resolvase RuvX [Ardenticatenales bacterium]